MTPYPPFKAKIVEPLPVTSREEREEVLAVAGFNLFRVPSDRVVIDLLTDSGTGAMSAAQWGRAVQGDESYAGSPSFRMFERSVRHITGMEHILPVHQGRAAERVLFEVVLRPGDVVPSNTAFDTTRANIERCGATVLDLPHPSAADPFDPAPFKGDIDLSALERALVENRGRVPLTIMTLTNNAGGGQPAHPSNVAAAAALCHGHGTALWIDAARYAENAALVQERDPAWRSYSARRVAASIFSHADGAVMSCKKDGLSHVGGFIAVRDRSLFDRLGNNGIATEGYLTYGGLSGRDLEALSVGLEEALDPRYLEHRLGQVRRLHQSLLSAGVPVVQPPGGHAVFVDAGALLPHVPPALLPGQALACALYVEGGVRGCEIGTLMFGGGKSGHAAHELLRLAIPRRVYETAHLDYVADVVKAVADRASELTGYELVEGDGPLRHFSARLRPAAASAVLPLKVAQAR